MSLWGGGGSGACNPLNREVFDSALAGIELGQRATLTPPGDWSIIYLSQMGSLLEGEHMRASGRQAGRQTDRQGGWARGPAHCHAILERQPPLPCQQNLMALNATHAPPPILVESSLSIHIHLWHNPNPNPKPPACPPSRPENKQLGERHSHVSAASLICNVYDPLFLQACYRAAAMTAF